MELTIYTHKNRSLEMHYFDPPHPDENVTVTGQALFDGLRPVSEIPRCDGPSYQVTTPDGWSISGPAELKHSSGEVLGIEDVLELAMTGSRGFSSMK